ncbi:DUF924 family protein [Acinetobacter baumannii]
MRILTQKFVINLQAFIDRQLEQNFGLGGKTPEGRLAEIIVLDQFSRNIYRDQPESFCL